MADIAAESVIGCYEKIIFLLRISREKNGFMGKYSFPAGAEEGGHAGGKENSRGVPFLLRGERGMRGGWDFPICIFLFREYVMSGFRNSHLKHGE